MYFVGIDVGLYSVKSVLVDEERILLSRGVVSEEEGSKAAYRVFQEILKEGNIPEDEIASIVSTGMGRKEVAFANEKRTDQVCIARGAYYLFPSARTVLDTGAGGCRAMKLGDHGKLIDFSSNSKCAGGTGSFLEAAARVLQLDVEGIDSLALKAGSVSRVSSYCAVFAESEIISNIHRGFSKESICAGICESIAQRMHDVLRRVRIEKEVVLCGGVATNGTVVKMFEAELDFPVLVPKDPLMVGALGAAIIARDLIR
nr:2-hydroxyglutaryl-CoA dehydratase [Desulfobacterales bacterium]